MNRAGKQTKKTWILSSVAIAASLAVTINAAPTPEPTPTPDIDRTFVTGTGATLPEELQQPALADLEKRHPGQKPKAILVQLVDCDSDRCVQSLRNIQKFIVDELQDENVVVLAVAVNSTADQVAKLTASSGITFPVIADKDRKLFSKMASEGVPRTLIADGDGLVVYTNSGYVPGREAEFRATIDALLAGTGIPTGIGDATSEPQPDEDLMARDVRGQQAPEVPVETWINPLPASIEGKYKLIDFWATWCGPCRASLEYSETIHHQFDDKLVTMAISDEPAAVVQEYVTKAKLKQPIGIDTRGRANNFLQIRSIPHAILINPKGIVVWQGHPMELWGEEGKMMREALGGKEFIPVRNRKKATEPSPSPKTPSASPP
ncbi:redoxin domain-containing protein [Candidatus Sumerlaeota bacterium]|nr:redoxin domain-containing protein [Candidatus Sumerlaeota bacterium]